MRRTALFRSVVAVTSALAVAAGGCGGGDDAEKATAAAAQQESFKIAFFSDALSNTYLQAAVDEAKTVAAKYPNITMDVLQADFDVNKQVTQIEDALSSGQYDAFVFEAIDGDAACKPLQRAIEQDVVVTIYNTPICGNYEALHTDGTLGYFGRSEARIGQWMGEWLATELNGKGKVARVTGPQQVSIVRVLGDAMHGELKKHPGIEVVAEPDGAWDSAKGLAATEDLLQAHPDLDGIVYDADNMTLGLDKALKKVGRLGQVTVVSSAGSEQGFALVRDGVISAETMSLPREEAGQAVEATIQHLNGNQIDIPCFDPATKICNVSLRSQVPRLRRPDVLGAAAGDEGEHRRVPRAAVELLM